MSFAIIGAIYPNNGILQGIAPDFMAIVVPARQAWNHIPMRFLRLTALLAVVAVAGAGCGPPADSPPDPGNSRKNAVLHRGNGGDPGTLDPALAEDIHAFGVLADLHEGLLAPGAAGELLPGVAASWDISDDGLIYRFALREDARWSNGDPVVAGDFIRAFRRISASDTPSAYGFLFEAVENFTAIKSGARGPEELGVVADNHHALTIRLERPTGYFLSVLAMPVAAPMHADAAYTATDADNGYISNGPYALASRRPGGPIALRRNTRYWDAGTVAIDSVVYHPIADEVAELNRFRSGELDITHSIPPSHIDSMRRSRPDETRIAAELALYYLALDATEPPLDDPHVRQALSMAIDRERLVAIVGRGELPAYGIVPPGVAGYDGPQFEWRHWKRTRRERAARELLESADFHNSRPLTLTYLYDAGSVHEKIALAVGGMWRDVLGIHVSYDKREWQHFLDTRANRDEWQVMRFSWFGDFNDPVTFLGLFASDSVHNLPAYKDAGYDRLLEQAENTVAAPARARLLEQAEERFLQSHAVIPLYFYVSKHMVNASLRGFRDNVLNIHPSRFLAF